jgi:DNA repair protein RadD
MPIIETLSGDGSIQALEDAPLVRPCGTPAERPFSARPYQAQCVDAVLSSMRAGTEFNLCVLPTGAGKTIIFSLLLRRIFELYSSREPLRVAVLAHLEKLVSQAHKKLLKVWPQCGPHTGIACATASKDVDVTAQVVVGSIQTVASQMRKGNLEPFHFIVVDEGHRVPWREQESQWRDFFGITREMRPTRKVMVVTATEYRLGHGYICGDRCKPGRTNWCGDPVYRVSMRQMIDEGHLVPYRIKAAMDIGPELRSVPFGGDGDYRTKELGQVMCRFVDTAVDAYERYGEDRRKVAVFCASIPHAEAVAAAFRAKGMPAAALHSKLEDDRRDEICADFSAGRLRFLCSVNALSEGYDEPAIDCVMLLRPTKSPGIYVQQVGRGERPCDGKADLLVLDLADCARVHGFPEDPVVTVPGRTRKGEPMIRICPKCLVATHMSAKSCPQCGYVFPRRVWNEPGHLTLTEVTPEGRGLFTKKEPSCCRITNVGVREEPSYCALELSLADAAGRADTCRVFVRDDSLLSPNFAAWWSALTFGAPVPKDRAQALAALRGFDPPPYGLFHKENRTGQRWTHLCGWREPDGDVPVPELMKSMATTRCRGALFAGQPSRAVRTA